MSQEGWESKLPDSSEYSDKEMQYMIDEFNHGILIGLEEMKNGQVSEYKFGVEKLDKPLSGEITHEVKKLES